LGPKLSAEDAKLEAKFVELCSRHPEGLAGDVLDQEMKDEIPVEKRKIIINSLTSRGRLRIWQDASGQIVYKILSAQDSNKFRGLGQAEMVIYQMIGREGNMGIWIRDIRQRSGIPQAQVEKILKTLKARKLVKCEKSIAAKNKKVYMLYELEPAKEVTGGAWYNAKGEFDTAFVDGLYTAAVKCISREGPKGATAEFVTAWIKQMGIFNVELTSEDIAAVLNAMTYDGVLEVVPNDDEPLDPVLGKKDGEKKYVSNKLYRLVPTGQTVSEFTSIPCSRCPVASQCSEDGIISPSTCEYFTKWLNF